MPDKATWKLTPETVLRIYQEPWTRGLPKKYGVSKTTIQNIRRGVTWRHVTGGKPLGHEKVTSNLPAYLLSRVEFEPNSGCWLWACGVDTAGYGKVTVGSPTDVVPAGAYGAHRLSWIVHRGVVPDGLFVLHRCDTPACINPDHLFLGTNADNVADMHAKGRRGTIRGYRRVSPETSQQIREALQSGRGVNATARDFGVGPSTVRLHREKANV